MKNMKLWVLAILITAAAALAGCKTVAITGRKQLNLVPDSTMNSMALSSYKEFLTQNKLSTDPEKTALIRRVGSRIRGAVEKYCAEHEMAGLVKDYQWEFNLVENAEVNAWCMPGGKVVVYTGLLPVAQDESGLAVVMGHEIAHAIARHGSERMSQQLMVQMGGVALSTAMSKSPALTKELFMKSYGAGAQYGVLLPYSRSHETEADRLGLIFMSMAGYQPNTAIAFWERMAAQSQGKKPSEFMSTHPSDEKRIANIRKCIPEAMQYYPKDQATGK